MPCACFGAEAVVAPPVGGRVGQRGRAPIRYMDCCRAAQRVTARGGPARTDHGVRSLNHAHCCSFRGSDGNHRGRHAGGDVASAGDAATECNGGAAHPRAGAVTSQQGRHRIPGALADRIAHFQPPQCGAARL
ncbi:hypothetical protein G6F65_012353 [Rhizopus arrhizus]|nr:hypothetical protein G6F65_012353 [Rhizopus arrhizus]